MAGLMASPARTLPTRWRKSRRPGSCSLTAQLRLALASPATILPCGASSAPAGNGMAGGSIRQECRSKGIFNPRRIDCSARSRRSALGKGSCPAKNIVQDSCPQDTPAKLIEDVCPDVLVYRGDYRLEQVVGREGTRLPVSDHEPRKVLGYTRVSADDQVAHGRSMLCGKPASSR
jgi:hypothetical protein